MVYTLVSSAQEFLHTIVEEISAAMDAKIQAAEEEQRKLDEIKVWGFLLAALFALGISHIFNLFFDNN